MRTFWNMLSFMAVVNLLALVMVVGWLWQSGRLTMERTRDIRTMLSTSATQAEAHASRLASEMEAERLRLQAEEARMHPAADSATQVSHVALVHQQSLAAQRRLEDERRMLAGQLDQATAHIEARARELEQALADTRNNRANDAQKRSDEQFLRAVRQLEQVTPKQAKKILETLVAEQKFDQAVSYLDAMNVRAASKVLREFKDDADIPLATELLERLRTRGVSPDGDRSAANETDSAHVAPLTGSNIAALPASRSS